MSQVEQTQEETVQKDKEETIGEHKISGSKGWAGDMMNEIVTRDQIMDKFNEKCRLLESAQKLGAESDCHDHILFLQKKVVDAVKECNEFVTKDTARRQKIAFAVNNHLKSACMFLHAARNWTEKADCTLSDADREFVRRASNELNIIKVGDAMFVEGSGKDRLLQCIASI